METTCPVCRALGAITEWGESLGEDPLPAQPPAEARLLEKVDEPGSLYAYRCPRCGNRFEWRSYSQSFLNNDYDSEAIRRLGWREYPSAEREEAHGRLLAELDDPDVEARKVAATVLARDSFDHPEDFRRELIEATDATVRLTALQVMRKGGHLKGARGYSPRSRSRCGR